jgi:hypothetical protein
MRTAPSVDLITDGRPPLDPTAAHRGPYRAPTRSPQAPRPGYSVPIVRELPRRWDPLADAEVVVREAA